MTRLTARVTRVLAFVLFALLVVTAIAVATTTSSTTADFGPGKHTADLVAGAQLLDVGDVEVYNDRQNVYVKVLPDGWKITEVQVYLGSDPIPVNKKGAPAPGLFPYKQEYAEPAAEHGLELHLHNDLGIAWGRPYIARHVQNIAVHVDLVNPETGEEEGAWAAGARLFVENSPAVGAWFSYQLQRPGKGHFIDSPVGGLSYRTGTYDAVTDESGSFQYYPGETVTLSLAGWPLGEVAGKHRVSPLDIFQTAEIDDIRVVNMARLLQSLDADGDPKAKIYINRPVQDALGATIAEWEAAEDEEFTGFDFTDYEMIDFLIDGTIARMAGQGVTLVKVSSQDALANLAKTLEETNYKFVKNVSKTPDLFTTKSRIELAPFYVPALNTVGEFVDVEYFDEEGQLIETRNEARPIVMAYLDEHPDAPGSLDVYSAVSLDDGNTWRRRNLSRSADLSSFTLANGEPYMGSCEKPSLHIKDDKILIVWTSKYAKGGRPAYAIRVDDAEGDDKYYPYDDEYYTEDIWGVGGPQRSTDYTDVEQGFPEVGEVPYNVVWTQRGVIDKATGDVTWYKPERVTSGRRNAMQLVLASSGNNVGFAIAWQEDPEGIRPGQGKGSGVGWSGAIASHGTDIWYSYIAMEDFAEIDTDWVSHGDPQHDWDGDGEPDDTELDGRPKAEVPFSLPVRISDNETINSSNVQATTTDFDNWTELTGEDGEDIGTHDYAWKLGMISGWYETTNWQGVDKQVAITQDDRLLDGDTAATRPALFLQGYTKPDGTRSAWAILGYEESKGVGGGGPLGEPHQDADDPNEDPDVPASADCDDLADQMCWDCHYEEHEASYDQTQCYSCHADSHAYVVATGEEPVDPDDNVSGDGIGKRYKPDIGKNIVYHSFDWQSPDLVAGGTILNQQAVDPETLEPLFLVDEEGQSILDWQDQPIPAYENARRPRFLVQGKALAITGKETTGDPATVMVVTYKQGEDGRGGPSDIFIRRWEITKTDTGWSGGPNPYVAANLVPGDTNCSSVTPGTYWYNPEHLDDEDKGVKLVTWGQTPENMDDYSWAYPGDNAQAQRGYLRGDLLVLAYTWTPNWRSARNGNDVYNLYVRRSFDGGKTFTTTPASDPYGVYDYNGQGATWTQVFKDPETKELTYDVRELAAGDFEPARNITMLTNHQQNAIEPRTVPAGPVPSYQDEDGVATASPYPENTQSFSTVWLTWGTGATHAVAQGDEEEEDHGKVPLDLQYTYSTDWGDTWVLEEKTIPVDSEGNHAGETVWRPFYLAKGVSMQGEAQVKFSPDASRAFFVWNDEGVTDELLAEGTKVEMDTFFRRVMPYEIAHNQADPAVSSQLIP